MRKLKLDLDALRVETFAPDVRESGGGSVVGHAVAGGLDDTATIIVKETVASWQRDCFSVLSHCETCGFPCSGYSCLFTACWWCPDGADAIE